MNKIKIIFFQTVMISAAILLGLGIQNVVLHFTAGLNSISWQWYIPISVVLIGFLCSLPTLLLIDGIERKPSFMIVMIIIHFIIVGAIVGFGGLILDWYDTWREIWPVLMMYIVIYALTWSSTTWISKSDEKKINEAISELRDSE